MYIIYSRHACKNKQLHYKDKRLVTAYILNQISSICSVAQVIIKKYSINVANTCSKNIFQLLFTLFKKLQLLINQ